MIKGGGIKFQINLSYLPVISCRKNYLFSKVLLLQPEHEYRIKGDPWSNDEISDSNCRYENQSSDQGSDAFQPKNDECDDDKSSEKRGVPFSAPKVGKLFRHLVGADATRMLWAQH
jgi:hypothetical protein